MMKDQNCLPGNIYDSDDEDQIFYTLTIQISDPFIQVYFPNEPIVDFDNLPPCLRKIYFSLVYLGKFS